jgi:hypothetical protein
LEFDQPDVAENGEKQAENWAQARESATPTS